MAFPKCEVFTRKQWTTARDNAKGKDGLSKQSMGKALDAFHAAIAKAEKKDKVEDADEAIEVLAKVAKSYLADVRKVGGYEALEKVVNSGVVGALERYKAALTNLKPGDFTDEVEAARQIDRGWKQVIEEYREQFESMKSVQVAAIKEDIGRAESMLRTGVLKDERLSEEARGYLLRARLAIPELRKRGDKLFSEFDTWAINNPRNGIKFIAKKLGPWLPESKAYITVATALKNELLDNGSEIAKTGAIWSTDILPQLALQERRLAILDKEIRGELDEMEALRTRLADEVRQFKELCRKVMLELKLEPDLKWLVKLKAGQVAAGEPLMHNANAQLFSKRLVSVDNTLAALQKQHKRIEKIVPDLLRDAFEASPDGKALAEAMETSRQRLVQARKLYEMLLDGFAKLGYEP